MAVIITTDDLAPPGQRPGAIVIDGLLFGVPFGKFADTLVLRDESAPWA